MWFNILFILSVKSIIIKYSYLARGPKSFFNYFLSLSFLGSKNKDILFTEATNRQIGKSNKSYIKNFPHILLLMPNLNQLIEAFAYCFCGNKIEILPSSHCSVIYLWNYFPIL